MKYDQIMVDIETTGTDSAHNAIIQIAAVAFNLEARQVSTTVFDQCLLIPNNRYWEESARDFWVENQAVLNKIWGRMRDPRTVLIEFNDWVHSVSEGSEPTLWAKPTHFEWPFLENYYRTYEIAKPFHYRKAEDLNSWCRARGLPDLSFEVNVEGAAHDAINDVFHQIQVLFTLLERTDVKVT